MHDPHESTDWSDESSTNGSGTDDRAWSLRALLPLLLCGLIAPAVLPVVVIGYIVADDTESGCWAAGPSW